MSHSDPAPIAPIRTERWVDAGQRWNSKGGPGDADILIVGRSAGERWLAMSYDGRSTTITSDDLVSRFELAR